jgi:hypothetical protein
MSPILVVGALLGQMKLPKPLAEKVASLFGLTESEKRMLNEVPTRGMPMPPTDPLLYGFYELVMVNGPALKALIEEEVGDGTMSAITSTGSRTRRATGSGSPYPASSCPTNITAPNRACRNTASRRMEERRRREAAPARDHAPCVGCSRGPTGR